MTKTRFSPQQLAFAGVFIALNIVLSRLVSIPVGATLRISIAAVPIFLAGLWLGPVIGAICGLLADLIGCLIAGYAPNPLITLSSMLWGVIPAILLPFLWRRLFPAMKKQMRLLVLVLLVLFITMLLTSLGLSTLGLSFYVGSPFWPLFVSRIPQTLLLWVADSLLVWILYGRIRLPISGSAGRDEEEAHQR